MALCTSPEVNMSQTRALTTQRGQINIPRLPFGSLSSSRLTHIHPAFTFCILLSGTHSDKPLTHPTLVDIMGAAKRGRSPSPTNFTRSKRHNLRSSKNQSFTTAETATSESTTSQETRPAKTSASVTTTETTSLALSPLIALPGSFPYQQEASSTNELAQLSSLPEVSETATQKSTGTAQPPTTRTTTTGSASTAATPRAAVNGVNATKGGQPETFRTLPPLTSEDLAILARTSLPRNVAMASAIPTAQQQEIHTPRTSVLTHDYVKRQVHLQLKNVDEVQAQFVKWVVDRLDDEEVMKAVLRKWESKM